MTPDEIAECVRTAIEERFANEFLQAVSEGEYPTGEVDLGDLSLTFNDLPRGTGRVEWTFSADHPSEDFGFDGVVKAEFRFNPRASTLHELAESVTVAGTWADFDMGNDDPPDDDVPPVPPSSDGSSPF